MANSIFEIVKRLLCRALNNNYLNSLLILNFNLNNPDWLGINHPDWPKNVKTQMSTRLGGFSEAPYRSLNLGDHVGDNLDRVQENRDLLAKTLSVSPVFLKQVHGNNVIELHQGLPQGLQADACFTRTSGVACTVMVADCLPILLTHKNGAFVAAAHAGWRGLCGLGCSGDETVLQSLIQKLGLSVRLQKEDLKDCLAWLGPCIGPGEFEVGCDVKNAFNKLEIEQGVEVNQFFTPIQGHDKATQADSRKKWLADLPGLARVSLRNMGVKDVFGNDGSDNWCTVRNETFFFSHRRDKRTGRQAVFAWLD
jgi:YfiH family protein